MNGLKVLAKLPIDSTIAQACDHGQVEEVDLEAINRVAEDIEEFCK